MKNGSIAIVVTIAAFLALLGAALGQDPLFRIHFWIITAVLALGVVLASGERAAELLS